MTVGINSDATTPNKNMVFIGRVMDMRLIRGSSLTASPMQEVRHEFQVTTGTTHTTPGNSFHTKSGQQWFNLKDGDKFQIYAPGVLLTGSTQFGFHPNISEIKWERLGDTTPDDLITT